MLIVIAMFGNHDFYGSTTVGERGQIVIPAQLREDMGIKPGDKLIVMKVGPKDNESIMIMPSTALNHMMEMMKRHFEKLMTEAEKASSD